MGFKKTKGESGEAKKFISRNKAVKLLQLKLSQFRILCILKGVYPREPKSRKKAQKGDTSLRTLYLKKDIFYLASEPIIWKLREEKICNRKYKSYLGKNETKLANFFRKYRKPIIDLDHIVLERYPSFKKALQDLDDPLNTCFLYTYLPTLFNIPKELTWSCRKLTVEFMNYVIEARALRKTFISYKGYYYRAEIQGVEITWIVPHPFSPVEPEAVDLQVMGTFVKFYATLLKFVNFKLYHSINILYPPVLPYSLVGKGEKKVSGGRAGILEALNCPLKRQFKDDEVEDSEYDRRLLKSVNNELYKIAKTEGEQTKKKITLFDGVKFFLGRETNRESLTFVIRSAGGFVSWDSSSGSGYTYSENHKDITYQIVDRPNAEKKHLSRYYVQPQWVYDSFNFGVLMPVQDYFPDVQLPAHLSPFDEVQQPNYMPPELIKAKALQKKLTIVGDKKGLDLDEDDWSSDEENDDAEEEEMQVDKEEEKLLNDNKIERKSANDNKIKGNNKTANPLSKMIVSKGKPLIRDKAKEARWRRNEDFGLAASFIHRKQRRSFTKTLAKEKLIKSEGYEMQNKRILYEKEMIKRKKIRMKEAVEELEKQNEAKENENKVKKTENNKKRYKKTENKSKKRKMNFKQTGKRSNNQKRLKK